MKVLCISDFHLGDGTPADDFGEGANLPLREDGFINFVESQNADKIFLVGDIMELWQCKEDSIKAAHQKILDYLNSLPNVVWIKGNHDYSLTGKGYDKLITASGKKILISHGYQNNPYMKNKFMRFLVYIVGWLERIIYKDIDKLPHIFAKPGDKTHYEKLQLEYAKEVLNAYDIVICGHTHRQKIEELENGILANCGTCQEGLLQGIVLDTDTDEIKMING